MLGDGRTIGVDDVDVCALEAALESVETLGPDQNCLRVGNGN